VNGYLTLNIQLPNMLKLSTNEIRKEVEELYEPYIFDTLSSPRTAINLKRWMLGFLLVFVIVLFLPWQQNINGKGSMTALSPKDRPQNIQNAIPGRIEEWNVREGQFVNAGDTLLVISEVKDDYFDPNLPLRLTEQIQAKNDGISSYQLKTKALDNQIKALRTNYEYSLQKARNKIRQSQNKVNSDSIDVVNEELQLKIGKDRYDRGQDQLKQGIISLNEWESRRLKVQENQAKLNSTQNKLQISKQDLLISRIEYSSVEADYREKISKAESDRSSALASLADGQSELSKLVNKKASVDVRRGLYIVRAPQDGYVVKALKAGIGENIKEGESICTLQPNNPDLAVELYVKAMDVPLIQKGREVRLQFEGFPALQFSGWPSVSVGTFGGTVEVIDLVDSKNGEYRLLIKPKKDDEIWPKQIRMGSGVFGWVMLQDVPVWYEIWRQLNAFPPTLDKMPEEEKHDKKEVKK
jgi:membrane fusion protein, adhesin transport system